MGSVREHAGRRLSSRAGSLLPCVGFRLWSTTGWFFSSSWNLHALSFLLQWHWCIVSVHNHSQDMQRTHSAGRQTRGCFRRKAAHPALNIGTVVVGGEGDLVHIASSRARHTFDPHCRTILTICPLLCVLIIQCIPSLSFLSGLPNQEKLLF